ncbi:MAG: protein kinase [Planctomycetota bacterium]|nr:protein kinase [Planctomycetota bacterium]
MKNQVICTNCSKPLIYAGEHAGKKLQCPNCNAIVLAPAVAQPVAAATAEKRLGNYLIHEELGRGGMGAVFLATDTSLNRRVALKVLSSKLVKNQTYVDRFLRESRSAAALQHPNIVTALDVGHDDGLYYFAMELVEGQNLRKLLKQQGAMTEERTLEVGICIAMALQHAWRKNIVHRDIKPDNIMIAHDGTVKLTDMGLAKATDNSDATLTQAGIMIGSPHYASPEQIRGDSEIDCRTDIYSLGISLYHMAVGGPPFLGETAGLVTAKQLEEPLPDPRQFKPYLTAGFCQLLQRMTEKDRDKRFQTPDEMFDAIQQVRAGSAPAQSSVPTAAPIAPRGVSSARSIQRKKSRSLAPLGFVALLLLTAGAVYFYLNRNESRPAVKPTPAVVRKKAPVVDKAQKAKANLSNANRFAASHPEDYEKVIGQYQEVWLLAAGTPVEADVLAAIESWKKKWKGAAEAKFNAVKLRSDSLAQANDVEVAVAAWKEFPTNLREPGIAERISTATGALQQPEETVETVAPESEEAGLDPESLQAALKDYGKVMESLGPLFKERNWPRIKVVTAKLLEQERTEPMRTFLTAFDGDMKAAQSFISVERIRSRIGQTLRFAGIESTLLDANEKEIEVKNAAGEMSKPLLKMRAKDFFELQGLDSSTASEKDLLAVGVLSFMDGKFKDATEFFGRLESPSATAYDDAIRFKTEVAANEKVNQLKAAVKSSDYRKTIAIAKTLNSEYGQTEIGEAYKDLIQESKEAALAVYEERAKKADALITFAEELTADKLKVLQGKYEAEKERITAEKQEAMMDPTGYVLDRRSTYSKYSSRSKGGEPSSSEKPVPLPEKPIALPEKPISSSEKPTSSSERRTSGRPTSSSKIYTYVYYHVALKTGEPITKSANYSSISEMLRKKDIERESHRLLKNELKRLKRELPAIKRRYESIASKLIKGARSRKSAIETRKRQVILQIKEGKATTQDEVKAYLDKAD